MPRCSSPATTPLAGPFTSLSCRSPNEPGAAELQLSRTPSASAEPAAGDATHRCAPAAKAGQVDSDKDKQALC